MGEQEKKPQPIPQAGELIPIPSGPEDKRGLTIYDRFKDVENGIKYLSRIIYNSKLFDNITQAQADMIAFACFCEKVHPFAIKKRYHIIKNNLAMRADAMQSGFMAAGGRLKVHEATSECVDLEGEFNGTRIRVKMTHEDAKKEPFYWDGSGKRPKHNWATPYMRGCMLWARVISTLVRRLTPFVVAGVYTPEEVMDFGEPLSSLDEPTPVPVQAIDVQAEPKQPVEAKVEVVAKRPTENEPAQEATSSDTPEEKKESKNEEFRASADQLERIKELAKQLGIGIQKMQSGLMKKYGVNKPQDLDVEQADELIRTFESALEKKDQDSTSGES